MTSSTTTWQNWARNQTAHPAAVHSPATEDELVAVVKQAAVEGRPVKVVSFGQAQGGHAKQPVGETLEPAPEILRIAARTFMGEHA